MLRHREIGVLYCNEMRMALRDRSIVIYSILMPLFLYPLLFWFVFLGFTFVRGQTEGMVSRVALHGASLNREAQQSLRRELQHTEGVLLQEVEPSQALEQMRQGHLDLLLEPLPGNQRLRLTVDSSRDRSVAARERVMPILERCRAQWLEREALSRDLDWTRFTLDSRNTASGRALTGFVLGMILPLCFTVMLAMSCVHPAIDIMAGERERNTWETLLSCGAERGSILAAKYLCVCTFGCAAGVMNVLALMLTLKPMLGELLPGQIETHLPFSSLPWVLLGGLLLAAFIAASMMILASFARTFKDGQAMISPFMMLMVLPVALLNRPDQDFTPLLALVPMVNVAMLIRSSMTGWPPLLPALITIGSSVLLTAACLRLALHILTFEDVLIGSWQGGFKAFVKGRLLRRTRDAGVADE